MRRRHIVGVVWTTVTPDDSTTWTMRSGSLETRDGATNVEPPGNERKEKLAD